MNHDKRITKKMLHLISLAIDGKHEIRIFRNRVYIRHGVDRRGKLILSMMAIGRELGYGDKEGNAGLMMARRLIQSGRLPAKQVSDNKWEVEAIHLQRLREERQKQR